MTGEEWDRYWWSLTDEARERELMMMDAHANGGLDDPVPSQLVDAMLAERRHHSYLLVFTKDM